MEGAAGRGPTDLEGRIDARSSTENVARSRRLAAPRADRPWWKADAAGM